MLEFVLMENFNIYWNDGRVVVCFVDVVVFGFFLECEDLDFNDVFENVK